MAKIYLGTLEIEEELATALGAAGYEVVHTDPPADAAAGDLSIVPAWDGITSDLRHDVLNAMTTVLGFTELLQRRMDLPEGVEPKLDRVREYGRKVMDLIRRRDFGDD